MKYQVSVGDKVLGNFPASDAKAAVAKAMFSQFTFNQMWADPNTVFTVREAGKNTPAVTFTRSEVSA